VTSLPTNLSHTPAALAKASRTMVETPHWRGSLESLLASDRSLYSEPVGLPSHAAQSEPDPLGLQFELVAARPTPARNAPSRADKPSRPGVRLRPVTRSSSGNWVRTTVNWAGLDYLVGWRATWRAGGYRPDHVALLR
jgi:hypothetical protein